MCEEIPESKGIELVRVKTDPLLGGVMIPLLSSTRTATSLRTYRSPTETLSVLRHTLAYHPDTLLYGAAGYLPVRQRIHP